jgi:pilus assembly protein CpaF
MFFITLAVKGGDTQQLTVDKDEVTIGRIAGNDLALNKGNVSKHHARITLKDGKYIVVDLKSTNGTFVNGKKLSAPMVVRPTDKIYIGDYIINVQAPPEGAEDEGEEPYDEDEAEEGYEEGEEDVEDDGEEPYDEDEPSPRADKRNMPASLAAAIRRRDNHVDPRSRPTRTCRRTFTID